MKKILSLVITLAIIFSMVAGFMTVSASEENYAWVLVDTHKYPIPEAESFFGSLEGNTIELQYAWPYGLGAYNSKDYDNPTDMHAIYTWSNPPSTIMPNETVTLKLEQNVISNRNGNYSIGFNPYFHMDTEDLSIGSATAGKVIAKITYADGTAAKHAGIGYNQDAQAQQSFAANMTLNFIGGGSPGDRHALYVGVYAGSPGSVGVRYTYEWKQISSAAPSTPAPVSTTTQANSAGSNAETFESGSRIMWQPADGLGYRLFRSTSKSNLGISVTDFYITGTAYADVNVEPNTTYYYTIKPVLAEAKPFEGIDEKLGAAIATYTVTTGSKVYKPGSYKHFIMLKLDNPNMSVDGVSQEVDPGRSTSPMTIAGRTMVPIRAVVEAMGGTIGWEQETRKITLTARGNVVEMWLDKTDIKINGVSQKMDVAPVSKNGRTFVPVRFAAENLNCKVDWINSTKEAVIVFEE